MTKGKDLAIDKGKELTKKAVDKAITKATSAAHNVLQPTSEKWSILPLVPSVEQYENMKLPTFNVQFKKVLHERA